MKMRKKYLILGAGTDTLSLRGAYQLFHVVKISNIKNKIVAQCVGIFFKK